MIFLKIKNTSKRIVKKRKNKGKRNFSKRIETNEIIIQKLSSSKSKINSMSYKSSNSNSYYEISNKCYTSTDSDSHCKESDCYNRMVINKS